LELYDELYAKWNDSKQEVIALKDDFKN